MSSFHRYYRLVEKNRTVRFHLDRLACLRPESTSFRQPVVGSSVPTQYFQRRSVSRVEGSPVSASTVDETDASTSTSTSTWIPPRKKGKAKALLELSKWRLSALVVSTASSGYLAFGGPVCLPELAACTVGTALCASSASALNQFFEVERDRRMHRTRGRPLPRGHLSSTEAVGFATATGVGGVTLLATSLGATTWTPAVLGAANIVLYAGVYTALKPRSEWNTWAGAVVGAVPPLMGWTAAGGSLLDPQALVLGGALYLWQFPHFFALAWRSREDYRRGGFAMVPVHDSLPQTHSSHSSSSIRGGEEGLRTAALITRYTWALATLPVISTFVLDVTGTMFAVEGLLFNGAALQAAHAFKRERTDQNARRVFRTSLWYLPCFLTLFLLHSKTWKEEDAVTVDGKEEETIALHLRRAMGAVLDRGRELCLHEYFVVSNPGNKDTKNANDHDNDHGENTTTASGESTSDQCPVVLSKTAAHQVKERGTVLAKEGAASAVKVTDAVAVAAVTGKTEKKSST